ncbi:hypothetical protein SLA2020_284950 [Shorea laevis]
MGKEHLKIMTLRFLLELELLEKHLACLQGELAAASKALRVAIPAKGKGKAIDDHPIAESSARRSKAFGKIVIRDAPEGQVATGKRSQIGVDKPIDGTVLIDESSDEGLEEIPLEMPLRGEKRKAMATLGSEDPPPEGKRKVPIQVEPENLLWSGLPSKFAPKPKPALRTSGQTVTLGAAPLRRQEGMPIPCLKWRCPH